MKNFLNNLIEQLKASLKKISGQKTLDAPKVSISEAFSSGANTSTTQAPVRSKKITKPKFEKYYPYVLSVLIGMLIADLLVIYFRPFMLPTQAPPSMDAKFQSSIEKLRNEYNVITDRNIFNSDGIIPPALVKEGGQVLAEDETTAVPSTLPLNLIGTIVHINPAKSVAAIQSKSSNAVIPYLPNDDIEGLAILIKIERGKAIFRNSKNGKLEYIEIPNESKLSFNVNKGSTTTKSGIIQNSNNEFTIKKEDLDRNLKNLPELLQQARAVPIFLPGTNEIDGFKLLDIQPGSIYEDLGLKMGDTIKEVNGQKVTSPAKAMELYNQLRNESNFNFVISRDGRDQTMTYRVD